MDVSLGTLFEWIGPPWNIAFMVALFIVSCHVLWKLLNISIKWCIYCGWPKLKWRVKGPFPIITWYELAQMEQSGWDIEVIPGNYNHYRRINGQLYKMDCLPKYMLPRKIRKGTRYNMILFYRLCESIEPIEMYQVRYFPADSSQSNSQDAWTIYFAPFASFGEAYQLSGLSESIGERYSSFSRRMCRRGGIYDYTFCCFLFPDEARALRLLTFLENRHIMRQLVTGGATK